MSLVQHFADAFLPVAGSAGLNGCVHFAASSGTDRMLVVVCRSHCEWRQTSCAVFGEGHVAFDHAGPHAGRGLDTISPQCSGNCSGAPRWAMEKSVLRNGPLQLLQGCL